MLSSVTVAPVASRCSAMASLPVPAKVFGERHVVDVLQGDRLAGAWQVK